MKFKLSVFFFSFILLGFFEPVSAQGGISVSSEGCFNNGRRLTVEELENRRVINQHTTTIPNGTSSRVNVIFIPRNIAKNCLIIHESLRRNEFLRQTETSLIELVIRGREFISQRRKELLKTYYDNYYPMYESEFKRIVRESVQIDQQSENLSQSRLSESEKENRILSLMGKEQKIIDELSSLIKRAKDNQGEAN